MDNCKKKVSKKDKMAKFSLSDESVYNNSNANGSCLRHSKQHYGGWNKTAEDVGYEYDEAGAYGTRRGYHDHMRQMDQMFMNPFGGFSQGLLALPEASSRSDRRRQQQQAQNMQIAERSMFIDPFSHFDSMFSNMRSMMTDMHRAFDQVPSDPNTHMYQQQSFMTYSSAGAGPPKIYQATSSTRQAGGVRETRKTVRDSESGLEKMAVGHHINERGHVVERSRNAKTGEQNENQDFINLDEEEAPTFDQEYQDKWRSTMNMRSIDQRRRGDRPRHALTNEAPYHRSRHAALPEPPRSRKSSAKKE